MICSAMDTQHLENRAHQMITEGTLPCGPHRVFAGFGESTECALCGQAIKSNEVNYEVVAEGSRRTLYFHDVCETIWRLECGRHLGGHDTSRVTPG